MKIQSDLYGDIKRDNGFDYSVTLMFIYFVWMALFNGGNFFGNNGNAALQGALTHGELADGLRGQDILMNQDAIQSEISSFEREAASTWGDIRYNALQNTYALQNAMTNGFFDITNQMNNNRFAQQECCLNVQVA